MKGSKESRSADRHWRVHITFESRRLAVPSAWIRATLLKVLKLVESDIGIPEVSEINLVITDDPRIRILNREHRGKDRPTDVLSFPQFEPDEISGRAKGRDLLAGPYLGDLVVSADTTLKQAREFGVSKRAELIRLLVHGVLHLCGYDHEGVSAAQAQRMRRRERSIRERLMT